MTGPRCDFAKVDERLSRQREPAKKNKEKRKRTKRSERSLKGRRKGRLSVWWLVAMDRERATCRDGQGQNLKIKCSLQ